MPASDLAADFSLVARAYCDWLENPPASEAEECHTASRLLAQLYAQALNLERMESDYEGEHEVSDAQRARILERLQTFPFGYYWEVFHPLNAEAEAGCGDIVDDLADIYFDIKAGLLAYQESESGAVNHWLLCFFHWGKHAVSALGALHAFRIQGAIFGPGDSAF